MTIKTHEDKYIHINKHTIHRIIVTLIGITILMSSIMTVITLTELVEPIAHEQCFKELWDKYHEEGDTHIAVPSNDPSLKLCKANYLPLACPWFIIVFALSFFIGIAIMAIGLVGWDDLW